MEWLKNRDFWEISFVESPLQRFWVYNKYGWYLLSTVFIIDPEKTVNLFWFTVLVLVMFNCYFNKLVFIPISYIIRLNVQQHLISSLSWLLKAVFQDNYYSIFWNLHLLEDTYKHSEPIINFSSPKSLFSSFFSSSSPILSLANTKCILEKS